MVGKNFNVLKTTLNNPPKENKTGEIPKENPANC